MLNEVNNWMEYASAGIDLLLLARILMLRLQRTYVFLTLACVLTVFFDAAMLAMARESLERQRLEIYASLLEALIFPLAAWDVFEELGAAVSALRRSGILRTATSLLMITFFGLILATPAAQSEDPNGLAFIFTLMIVVSTGSATGCLAFLWVMRRALRQQNLALPKNTSVWLIFWGLQMCATVVQWFFVLIVGSVGSPASSPLVQITQLVLIVFDMAISVWCALKLRALPKDLAPAPLNENL